MTRSFPETAPCLEVRAPEPGPAGLAARADDRSIRRIISAGLAVTSARSAMPATPGLSRTPGAVRASIDPHAAGPSRSQGQQAREARLQGEEAQHRHGVGDVDAAIRLPVHELNVGRIRGRSGRRTGRSSRPRGRGRKSVAMASERSTPPSPSWSGSPAGRSSRTCRRPSAASGSRCSCHRRTTSTRGIFTGWLVSPGLVSPLKFST